MAVVTQIVAIESREQAAAPCLVCGSEIAAGEGVTAEYLGRILRFKCPRCLARFQANPEPFLAGQPGGCCGGAHDRSPASEWSS